MTNVVSINSHANLPDWLKNAKRWLVYKLILREGKKSSKIPYYVDGTPRSGTLNSAEDIAKLATFEQATAALKNLKLGGLGFALGEDGAGYWQGLDLDNINEHPEFNTLIEAGIPGYVERSPSGNGVHAIGYGRGFRAVSKNNVEAYSTARFFTVTSNIISISDQPEDLYDYIEETVRELCEGKELEPLETDYAGIVYSGVPMIISEEQKKDLRSALLEIPPHGYDEWYRMGKALKTCQDGFDIWHEWSKRSYKHTDEEALEKWERDLHPTHTDYRAVFAEAQRRGWINPRSNGAVQPLVFNPAGYNFQIEQLPEDFPKRKAREWILDGQVPRGVFTIAGMRGAGKTTMLATLATIISGICNKDHPMLPVVQRRVVWVSEDLEQIQDILAALYSNGLLDKNVTRVNDMLKLARASRRKPQDIANAIKALEGTLKYEQTFRNGNTYSAEPLFILDTFAATVDLEDANSNAEVSRAVAFIRQAYPTASIWIVTHVAKAHYFGNVDRMTAVGASSLENDVQGTIVIARRQKEEDEEPDPEFDNKRFFIVGKLRAFSDLREITATLHVHEERVSAPWDENAIEKTGFVSVEATTTEDRLNEEKERQNRKKEEKAAVVQRGWVSSVRRTAAEFAERGYRGLAFKLTVGGETAPRKHDGEKRGVLPPSLSEYHPVNRDELAEACGIRGRETKATLSSALKESFPERDGWLIIEPAYGNISGLD